MVSFLCNGYGFKYSDFYECAPYTYTRVLIDDNAKEVWLSTIILSEGSQLIPGGLIKGSYQEHVHKVTLSVANGLYNSLSEMGFYNTPNTKIPSYVECDKVIYTNTLPFRFVEEWVQRRHRYIRYEWNLYGAEDPRASPVNLDWGTPKNKFRQVSRLSKGLIDTLMDWSWGPSLLGSRRRIDRNYCENEPKDVITPEHFINLNKKWNI